jgi:spore coat protein CotH
MKIRLALFVTALCAAACGESDPAADPDGGVDVDTIAWCAGNTDGAELPTGWSEDTHCKADPNYDLLFDDTAVQRIDVTISADDHAAMMDDLDDLLGGQGGPPGPPSDTDEDPMWVPVTIEHDGRTWNEVGMRYKGNSSLRSAYSQGIGKLSFRLSFDKYEDEVPELDDQRFYGFKKMTFSNGFNDPSLIRDKLAADIFRAHGIPAARGAFARVYVDVGEGPVYFGLYTMIEDPSNRMLDTQFADDSGNLYKPEGDAAAWGSFSETDFEKKTNEDEADWSDVIGAIDALHADRSIAAAWRADLEAAFDVYGFIAWLAANQAMVNWDTYGWMTHNYYLYADPEAGRLVWFPWDLNEAIIDRGGNGPWADASSVSLDEIGDEWPLIRYVLDDAEYADAYAAELTAVLDGAFSRAEVSALIDGYHALIEPYVVGADGESGSYTFLSSDSAFTGSVADMKSHVSSRHAAVEAFVD